MTLYKEPLNILVVEDHLGDYILIEEYLTEEHQNLSLYRASTFAEAKKYLTSPTKFDAILLDLSLPDSLGAESLVRDMVDLAWKTPVVVLTGYSNKDFGVKTLSLGISDYLLKDDLNAVQLSKSIYYSIERKKIEFQLTESEKKYKSLFELSPMPMWVVDRKDLRFLSVNAAAVNMYGFSREEFLNMKIRDLWTNKEEPAIEELLNNKNDDYFNLKVSHTTKTGEEIFLDVQSNPILFDGIEARVSLVNNITARITAEKALMHSEQRFKALVQDGSDLVMILDCKGNFKYVSPSAKAVTGVTAEKLKKNNFFYMIHQDDVDSVKDCIHQLESQKRIQIPAYRIKSSGNKWRWIETIVTNLAQDPAVNGIVANSRDITDFVLQEKQLRESLTRYDIVAKATSDTITDYDVKNDLMHYNEGIENMFGYKREDVDPGGCWWEEKVHPDDRERVNLKVADVYANRTSQLQIEYRFRCADGSYKYVLDRSYMVRDSNGNPSRMIGSMQDITELKNYVQTIEENNRRLKEIAWTQSHVVRAPLARIMGLIDLLQNYDDVEDVNLLLSNILSSARELDGIIRKINSKTEDATLKGVEC
jgi:PAS domain S-box-containing protein